MTTTDNFAPIRPLIDEASRHLRITTAIMEGNLTLAEDLTITRAFDIMRGYAEGDIIEDPALLLACQTIDQTPICVIRMTIRLLAHERIELMSTEQDADIAN